MRREAWGGRREKVPKHPRLAGARRARLREAELPTTFGGRYPRRPSTADVCLRKAVTVEFAALTPRSPPLRGAAKREMAKRGPRAGKRPSSNSLT